MQILFPSRTTSSTLSWRVAALWFVMSFRCAAHDPGLSSADVFIGRQEVNVRLSFAPADVAALPHPKGPVSPADVAEWRVDDEHVVVPTQQKTQSGSDNIEFSLVFPRSVESAARFNSALLDQLPHGHRQLLTVRDPAGVVIDSRLLSGPDNSAEIQLTVGAELRSATATFFGFVLLGIQHILTGYDHLLFLCALLLICESFRATITVITCFTLAHSITLALATFEIVSLPSGFVEPLIAASIVYVGIENIVARKPNRWRWLLTFSFGLIHGLGFAAVLRDLGIGVHGTPVIMPLLSFNLGVELGQIAVAAVVLPLLFHLRRTPWLVLRGVPAASLVIACAGAYWLIQRTLL